MRCVCRGEILPYLFVALYKAKVTVMLQVALLFYLLLHSHT